MKQAFTLFSLLMLTTMTGYAANPQKTVIDYFMMLPLTAFTGKNIWMSVGNTVFTPVNKKRILANYAGKPMPVGTKADEKETNIYLISNIDTPSASLSLHDQTFRTAHLHIWREKSGMDLIGVCLMETPGNITRNEVTFYRYDGTKLAKVENLLPKLPISEFVNKSDLDMDSISPALTPIVIYDFPSAGDQTISCRLDFAFWNTDTEGVSPTERPYQNLTTNQVHEVVLQLTADGFKVVRK